MTTPFSIAIRNQNWDALEKEQQDFLIVGGGITGAAVARDLSLRGYKVGLVEKRDWASGTSSKSSKLIHGGLRYLENKEFGLVFEALSERSFLLSKAPQFVKPLKFFMPVYRKDTHPAWKLSLGLWLYDLLALFRTPYFHRRLSRKQLLEQIPFLRQQELVCGFSYADASMWDDGMVVETARSAQTAGAKMVTYASAMEPIFEGTRLVGFVVEDQSDPARRKISVRAKQVVLCVGPWTDDLGRLLQSDWKPRLKPSRGIHLVFSLKRMPIPGAIVMAHPTDGRISFVIPRTDLGDGVVIVGTTDAPEYGAPDKVSVSKEEVDYLFLLLNRYFPDLKLGLQDVLSAYVGIRPLLDEGSAALQKVSREHHIELGPSGFVWVAGGKYTTHRLMAQEIAEFSIQALARSPQGASPKEASPVEVSISKQEVALTAVTKPKLVSKEEYLRRIEAPINPKLFADGVVTASGQVVATDDSASGTSVMAALRRRYGKDALAIGEADQQWRSRVAAPADPDGFPCLLGCFVFEFQHGMVISLEDFILRRVPLFLARQDHGAPWFEALSRVWAQLLGKSEIERANEITVLESRIAVLNRWREQWAEK